MADLSRELDGTGVKIDGEIRVETVERSTAHGIAEDFKLFMDIIGWSASKVVKEAGRKRTKPVRGTLGAPHDQLCGQVRDQGGTLSYSSSSSSSQSTY
jgi:hypothetical protein